MFACLAVVAFAALTTLPVRVEAHSWNEQLSLIGDNGSFVANGYPRGYIARTDPGYDGNSMMWMIPGAQTQRIHINDQDLLCHTNQRNPTQTPNYPRLGVAPGSAIAMKYLENGHVTLPATQQGKQQKGGTVFVFGTTQPKSDEKLSDVLSWNADGSGGDKRGKLIQAQNFDDDRCYQINGGPISTQRQQQFPNPMPGQPGTKDELWCESNAIIPKDAPVGKPYTLYWVWQWPTMPGGDSGYPQGKDEYYTTCNDVDVQAQAPQTGRFANTLKQQDPQEKPVQAYLSRAALEPTPWPQGVAGASSAPSASPSASTPAPASASAAPAPSASPAAAAPAPSPASGPMEVEAPAPGAPTQPMSLAPASSSPAAAAAPSTATPAPAAAQGAAVTPLPLSAFTAAAASSSVPQTQTQAQTSAAPAAATPAAPAPSSAPAAAATPAGMQVLTVPAGNPVFMVSGGKVVTLARRAGPTAAVAHARRHRVGGKHGRWFGD